MTMKELGGANGDLTCMKKKSSSGRTYYFFESCSYGMECVIYEDEINSVLNNEFKRSSNRWGSSWSNSVKQDDADIILKYIRGSVRKYKNVDDVLKSRSKIKKKHLMKFTLDELYDYIKKKEKDYGKVESCC